jgi:hypothetical protein
MWRDNHFKKYTLMLVVSKRIEGMCQSNLQPVTARPDPEFQPLKLRETTPVKRHKLTSDHI